ncbi:zf-CHY-domain-containing protein [Daldinia caldariorum]|uniref:zf-CHY-domain-containing protein n=1 Tax=Daldinia caldariorum TaxID=326644 RepID=UPI002007EA27|nr:zf-CHY-domain-containing protein [Daldinia caldariorum]KAI1471220.1 zf-CHY-domain-containing protein [Daldinia caldariorum]
MASLVTDFLVNPVIRQARRFSRSSGNLTTSDPVPSPETASKHKECQDEVTSETEEDSYLDDEVDESIPSSPSSRSSVHPNPHNEVADLDENISQFDATNRTLARNPDTDLQDHDIPNLNAHASSLSIGGSTMATNPLLPPADLAAGIERRKSLPEDDGMSSLRKRIFAIQAQDVEPAEKARLMHQLLMEGYTKSTKVVLTERPLTPSSPTTSEQRRSQGPLESFKFWQHASDEPEPLEEFDLTAEDLQPTFAPPKEIPDETGEYVEDPEDDRPLGCEHYRRNVKLQCSTCNRWYTCRFCHDKVEDHNLIRKETRNMLCMYCGTAQRASDVCISCGVSAARYYCNICKLWNDDPDKPVYHCNDCGICRIGRGLGKDFFHCKTCSTCIGIGQETDHKCIERSTDCDCPICGDYMFTSPKAICFMKCGHSIHRQCLDQHMKVAYKCPICNKSLTNMELRFRNLDIAIQTQPMPAEFQDTRALILCNDCSTKSTVKYHWLGLKCGLCASYNTAQLRILGMVDDAIETDLLGREIEFSELTALRGIAEGVDGGARARDIRRRHSSTVARSTINQSIMESDYPDRQARSVSPPGWNTTSGYFITEADDEDREDILGFWSRLPRSITSDDDEDDANYSEEESISSSEDEEDEDEGDEDEEIDDFELLGHR